MATIRDVAKRASVAPITVSRVINNSGYISDETRAKVEAAIHELQYVPNSLSRSLRFKRTNTISLLLSDITNPFWTTTARGAEDACSEHNMNVFLCNTDEKQTKLDNYVDVMLQRQTDGFLLVPASNSRQTIERIREQSVPLVLLDRVVEDIEATVVRSDSLGGSRRLVEYLIGQGHRRIAMLAGVESVSTTNMRIEGYRQALAAHDISYDPALIRHGHYSLHDDRNIMLTRELVQEEPTAIYGANNFISFGILQALHQMGLRTPEDMSVVSFDDLPYNWHPDPFLTVIAQTPYQLGYRAADLLLSFIHGNAATTASTTSEEILPVELIERRSVRRLTPQSS